MKPSYPDCYKDVFINYAFPGEEMQVEEAWLAVNDNGEFIWTLSKDDTTIIPDKYVKTWISIYK